MEAGHYDRRLWKSSAANVNDAWPLGHLVCGLRMISRSAHQKPAYSIANIVLKMIHEILEAGM
jgi:hypothetical protein